jgi:(1->4)-alpha-D-glucan 1-alpha-D-glucosylmutase
MTEQLTNSTLASAASTPVSTEQEADTIIRDILTPRHVPRATYRLQMNPSFTFADVQAVVPYLRDLGISDAYLSPILTPRTGSTHGYDITDPGAINPELGGESGFESLSAALRDAGLSVILDIVPNHMGIFHERNTWWMDVLENGPASRYASYFDIDWMPIKAEITDKVLLPILGDQYGKVLESGSFKLLLDNGKFIIDIYGMRLPVAPRTYAKILGHRINGITETLGEDNESVQELLSILTALRNLPSRYETDPEKVTERYREKEVIKRRIAVLHNNPDMRASLDRTLEAFNGVVGDPRSFDLMDDLINAQCYRPAFWRVAAEEINYRRFFDVNDLAAIRVERPEVFQATHQLVFRLLSEGKAHGLRIDHPDGLWNPPRYFRMLQEQYVLGQMRARFEGNTTLSATTRSAVETAVTAWFTGTLEGELARSVPLYVVVEKILSEKEPLPAEWWVHGTTGYDFMTGVNSIFVNNEAEESFTTFYRQFTGHTATLAELMLSSKRLIMSLSLVSEVNSLAHELERITERNRRYRDFTLLNIIDALREIIASMQVYRTYTSSAETVSERDVYYITAAVHEAKGRNPRIASEIYDFICDTLLLRNLTDFHEEDREGVINFVMHFQQVTGPVMAKSVEDTSFYIYNRLVSLNEVGGNPEMFGMAVSTFHDQNMFRCQHWTESLLSTSTHDTKRSEDVRARINVLSEMPQDWQSAVTRWSVMNASAKTATDTGTAPDRNDEYLLYQTLIGAYPSEPPGSAEMQTFRERITAYLIKAAQEAKVNTSWVNPNKVYTDAIESFVGALLTEDSNPFLADFVQFQQRVAYFGRFNSLSQMLLKLTVPGIPDLYQGTEMWDLSLVDPDNRRPVDYARRQSTLAYFRTHPDRATLLREVLDNAHDGRIKLFMTHAALLFRRDHEMLFRNGDYFPLQVQGDKYRHVCTFARRSDEACAIVAVPRLVVGLTNGVERSPIGGEVWGETWIALPFAQVGQRYRDVFTEQIVTAEATSGSPSLKLAHVLSAFPVALLEQVD